MQNFLKKLFLYKKDNTNTVWRIFGIKISYKNKEQSIQAKKIQDNYDLHELQTTKKLIVFFVPKIEMITGGILSIYSICQYTREICEDYLCIISTPPGKRTYSHNNYFDNDEKIFRWEQIVQNAQNAENVILHVPDFLAGNFYDLLNRKQVKFLKSIKNLQLNILNQNSELMPSLSKLNKLYKLTDNITQTIANQKYAQSLTTKNLPMVSHFLSVYIDINADKVCSFDEKEKIIVVSPDKNSFKEKIIKKIKYELPDYSVIQVENLPFEKYLELISKAFFTISFGEGFDGYFNQPVFLNSIGFSVYNERFFPDKDWLGLENVFSSYEELENEIINKCIKFSTNKAEYAKVVSNHKDKLEKLESKEKFIKNLKDFYNKKYNLSSFREGME